MFFPNPLRSPITEPAAAGAVSPSPAPSPQPSGTPGGAPPPSPAPQAQPAGRTVTEEEWQRFQRAEQRVAGHDRNFAKLKELGFEEFDKAYEELRWAKNLKSNEHVRPILEALTAPQPPAAAPTQSQGTPIDSAAIRKMIADQFVAHETEQFRSTYQRDRDAEDNLLMEMWSDPRYKPFIGDLAFKDAVEGKGSRLQQALAALADQAFAATAGTYPNGQLRPVTTRENAQQAREWFEGALQEMRAQAILAASVDSTRTVDHRQHYVPPDASHPATMTAREESEARRRAAAETMRLAMAGVAGSVPA